jgi:diadenosine tetraphosphatase ApaH/serine/threonine PP2A family protein phosphatase
MDSAAYLRALPEIDEDDETTLVHGSLRGPMWEYLSTYKEAEAHFALQRTPLSFVGHTHIALVVRQIRRGLVVAESPIDGEVVQITDEPTCINPGGLGQPRDGDPRASYALLNTTEATVTFHRVEYDVERTQLAMLRAGLPEALIARLAVGR